MTSEPIFGGPASKWDRPLSFEDELPAAGTTTAAMSPAAVPPAKKATMPRAVHDSCVGLLGKVTRLRTCRASDGRCPPQGRRGASRLTSRP